MVLAISKKTWERWRPDGRVPAPGWIPGAWTSFLRFDGGGGLSPFTQTPLPSPPLRGLWRVLSGALGVVTEKGDWQISGAKRDAPANPNVSNLSPTPLFSFPQFSTEHRRRDDRSRGLERALDLFRSLHTFLFCHGLLMGGWSQQSWRLRSSSPKSRELLFFGAKFCQIEQPKST